MGQIDRDRYLAHARDISERERELVTEFSEWLPATIIDCHAHCNLSTHVRSVDARAYNHMLSTFPSFSLEESASWQEFLNPGKFIRTLRFPKTFRGIDHRAANDYLLAERPAKDRIAVYGLPDDVDYTVRMLEHPRASALKMYYSYLEPPATHIYQYFPKEALEAAQSCGKPIILHLPRIVTKCLDQAVQLFNDFPKLKVCIAHLGLTKKVVPGLREAYSEIATRDNVVLDTSLVPSAEVVTAALSAFGASRVLYGSDEPLNLIRSALYEHPKLGQRLVTTFPYHWADPIEHEEFKTLAADVPHAHWQCLSAIREAVEHLPLETQENTKQLIFETNAAGFYGF